MLDLGLIRNTEIEAVQKKPNRRTPSRIRFAVRL
jgi:hypothetical protein